MTNQNIPFVINIYPWARSYNLAVKKENTCIFSIVKTEAREPLFKWVEPLIEIKSTLWGLKNDNIEITSLDDVKAHTVAAVRNSFAHSVLLKKGFVAQKNLYIVDSTHSVVKLLYTRSEINFIVAAYSTIYYEASNANVPFDELEYIMPIYSDPLHLYLACNINTADKMIEKIKMGFMGIKVSGQLNAINKKWEEKVGKNLMSLPQKEAPQ